MSFQEMRSLLEQLRALGFPRLVSLENFSSPNFPLVSEVLLWLASCADFSRADLPSHVDTEMQRVTLITTAGIFFYQSLGVQLNTKSLYRADRLAARELLKITSVLTKATQSLPSTEEELPPPTHLPLFSLGAMQEVRQLASSITLAAASLSDSLQREVDNKVSRLSAVQQVVDMAVAEERVLASQGYVETLVAQLDEDTRQLDLKQKELDDKILRKNESLLRKTKRLEALRKIKPVWQSEFQRDEEQLREVWQEYVTKHIYLSYLQNQLEIPTPPSPAQERESAEGGGDGGAAGGVVGKTSKFSVGVKWLEDENSESDDFGPSSSEDDNTFTSY